MNHKAFSLIELLISLIIISIIISALAPVITKKLKKGAVTQGQNYSEKCEDIDKKCSFCNAKKECIICNKDCENDEYKDIKKCSCKLCNDKWVNCAKCEEDKCLECQKGYFFKNEICTKITDAPCLNVGNICIAKFNAGDGGGLSIPQELIIIKPTGTYSSAIIKTPTCWRGTTSTHCNANNGGYSGCNRTVCNWIAAEKICKYHGWRLPTRQEGAIFWNYVDNRGANGLQLCSYQSSSAYALCSSTANTCPGASSADSFNYAHWINEEYYFYRDHRNYPEKIMYATGSVRCIRE